jgi:GlcNAc-P-P-Und epimerase
LALVGGAGFIGRALANCAAPQASLRVVDIAAPAASQTAPFVIADICDVSGLKAALQGCTGIIHLAAVHRDDVHPITRYWDVNVLGTENVCAAATLLGIRRIIFVSSVATYGLRHGTADEDTRLAPANAYGESKRQAEEVVRAWQEADPARRELVIVRPTVVFGPGNRGNVYTLMSQIAAGRFVMVGDGENRKSMAYVENVAAFLAHLAAMPITPGARLYNYCDQPTLTMNELLSLVYRTLGGRRAGWRLPLPAGLAIAALFDVAAWLTGRTFSISRVRVRKFAATTAFTSSRMGETGFVAPFPLREALIRTITAEFGR